MKSSTSCFILVALIGAIGSIAGLRCYSNHAGHDGDGHRFEGEKKAGECPPGFNLCAKMLCDDGQDRYACASNKEICGRLRCTDSVTTACSTCSWDLCNGGDGGSGGGSGGGGGGGGGGSDWDSGWDNGAANANGLHLLLGLLGSLGPLAAFLLIGMPHLMGA